MPRTKKTSEPARFDIPLQPVPASRPRVTRQGWTYYPKRHKEYAKAAASKLPSFDAPFTGHLCVSLEFIFTKARTSKLTTPSADVDNLAKMPLDLLTKAKAWGDDKQVVELHATKRFAAKDEEPRTRIEIHPIEMETHEAR